MNIKPGIFHHNALKANYENYSCNNTSLYWLRWTDTIMCKMHFFTEYLMWHACVFYLTNIYVKISNFKTQMSKKTIIPKSVKRLVWGSVEIVKRVEIIFLLPSQVWQIRGRLVSFLICKQRANQLAWTCSQGNAYVHITALQHIS